MGEILLAGDDGADQAGYSGYSGKKQRTPNVDTQRAFSLYAFQDKAWCIPWSRLGADQLGCGSSHINLIHIFLSCSWSLVSEMIPGIIESKINDNDPQVEINN